MKDFVPKPLPVRLREWQAAGGRLEIQSARIAQGETLANATGTLALTQRGRLDGALQLNVAGLEKLLPAHRRRAKGAPLNLDRAAPALNAIDRAVPGLGAAHRAAGAEPAGRVCSGCSGSRSRSRASAASRCRCASPMAPPRSGRSRSGKCRRRSRTADAMHDAVIIGGGHNGLVCAAYLAMAGLKVVVLERRHVVGGAAVTEEFHPGFRNSVASYTVSLLNPKVIADLRLAEHGLRIVERAHRELPAAR